MAEEDNGDIIVKMAETSYTPLPSIAGWERDDSLSNKNYTTYTKGGKSVIAYRGTDLKNPKTRWDDLGTDLLLTIGLADSASRFKNAKKVADRAVQKYGENNVNLVGHSLGGSQSAWVSRKTGLKGTGFNTGWSPIDALRKRTYTNFKNVRVEGDPVSYFGRKLGRTTNVSVKPKMKNKHSLLNFI
jgi:hypothetical protein